MLFNLSDYKEDIGFLKKIIEHWDGSAYQQKMQIAKDYYDGNNTTINQVKKEMYLKNDNGRFEKKTNPFISNYKIATELFKDSIDQKVYTLLSKSPMISGLGSDLENKIKNKLDYAIQNASVKSSIYGYSFIYIGYGKDDIDFKVFDSRQTIGFVDDVTEELRIVIRYWYSSPIFDNAKTDVYVQVFSENGISAYKNYELVSENPYIQEKQWNAYQEEIIPKNWKLGFPIVLLKNNDDCISDFNRAKRAQIDSIDIVNSEFANNLTDFQDVYTIIKSSSDGMSASSEEIGNFYEQLKSLKSVNLGENQDISTVQVEIPHAAKMAFIDTMKTQFMEDAGMINTNIILNGSMTATAIHMGLFKLDTRVDKFEYFVFDSMASIIRFIAEEKGIEIGEDFEIVFIRRKLSNDTEIILNLVSSSGMLSQKTILEMHPYVGDAEEELSRLEEESVNKFTLPKVNEGGEGDE